MKFFAGIIGVAWLGWGLESVRNVRRLAGVAARLPLLRSASLDNATAADVAALRADVRLVVDLRNDDERRPRSAALERWYASPDVAVSEAPLLADLDAFWAAVARLAPPPVWARAQALWTTRPLEAALARNLEAGGCALLYEATLASAPEAVGRAVAACAEGDGVLFHCHKGKDRTGVVAALVEEVVGVPRAETVAAYAASSALLGDADATSLPAPASFLCNMTGRDARSGQVPAGAGRGGPDEPRGRLEPAPRVAGGRDGGNAGVARRDARRRGRVPRVGRRARGVPRATPRPGDWLLVAR